MKKDKIRTAIKAQKALLNEEEKKSAAKAAFEHLEKTAAFMMAEHIMMYHSLADELFTHDFLDKWHTLKHFYLPRVNGVNLDILPYDKSRMHLGSFHIEEPDGADTVPSETLELIVVPGVAFDRKGNRVGRGKGFYDRLLAETKAITIGIGYDFQVVDEIDTDDFDVPVDYVITERHIYRAPARKKR